VTRVYKPFSVAVVLVLILASAGCAELPPGGGFEWSGGASPPAETPAGDDPDPGYLAPVTPYPTATSDMARPTFSRPPETTPTPDTYVTIYNQTIQYPQATKAFSFDLTTPPLIIEFGVEPKMITRTKHAKSDYGKREYKDYKQTFPSENAWFVVTVRDRESGMIVAEEGFGKLYSTDTQKKVFVGRSGNYQIQLAGNDARVHVLMRAGGV
jgi:hypothetical protein